MSPETTPAWTPRIPGWINALIVGVYRLVGGLATSRTLLLTTTGPRTGRAYVTPLFYLREGDAWLVTGSSGGAPKDPAWIRHLHAGTPTAIEVGRRRVTVRPEFVAEAEAARIYERFIAERGSNYKGYRERTSRPMPVVRLVPS